MGMLIFVYQTICEVNGKSYIGVHKTDNLNDGYIGCGISRQSNAKCFNLSFHRAVNKYGYPNFRRYILCFCDTYEEALNEERHIVNTEWVKSKNNYNTAIGGRGNNISSFTDEQLKDRNGKISCSVSKWLANGGLEKVRIAAKTAKRNPKFGKDNHFYGGNKYVQRAILQYSKELGLIRKYNSITEAATSLSVGVSGISSCCTGRYLTCNNFVFRYDTYSEKEKAELDKNLIRAKRIYKPRVGYRHSDVTKRKISDSNKGKRLSNEHILKLIESRKGIKYSHSETTKNKISEKHKGRKLSLAHKSELSKNSFWKGKKLNAESKTKLSVGASIKNRIAVVQFDREGNFIKEFSHVKVAAQENNCSPSAIIQNLKNRSSYCRGYVFKYKLAV